MKKAFTSRFSSFASLSYYGAGYACCVNPESNAKSSAARLTP
jgi:hypothetical protein